MQFSIWLIKIRLTVNYIQTSYQYIIINGHTTSAGNTENWRVATCLYLDLFNPLNLWYISPPVTYLF